MRTAIFKGIGQPLSIDTLPDPTPGPGEVVLKIGRCGTCATDLHMTETTGATFPVGTAVGHEYAGEVVALGRGVERLRVGDRVAAMPMSGCRQCVECFRGETFWCAQWRPMMGGFGEYAIADSMSVVQLPSVLSMADGALVEPLSAALNGVHVSGMFRGARVLVLGVGPMGLGTIFWARRMGAGRIVAAAKSNRRARTALEMGATTFLTTGGEGFPDAVNAALGVAPDIVFECTGVPGALELAVTCVRRRGTVVGLGLCLIPDAWIPGNAMNKQVRLQFAAAYTMADFHHCIDTLSAGALEPRTMISDTVSLDHLPQAFEALRHRSIQGKLMVDPWASTNALSS